MTSYGVDYEFLAYLFRDSRLVQEPNLMTVVDNYDHSKNAPQVRQGTKEKPFRVVWPPFYDKHASSQVRERLKTSDDASQVLALGVRRLFAGRRVVVEPGRSVTRCRET